MARDRSLRIGLFGGSFNPPHCAHQLLALYLLETGAVDELWYVPAYRHAFGKPLAPYAHRVAMCEQAVAPLTPRASVSRVEETLALAQPLTPNRTFDTLTWLVAQHPLAQFRLVIGTDILADTAKWYRWADVCALAPPIVVGRAGHHALPQGVMTEVALPNISSTEIRRRISQGETVQWLLPRTVLEYIETEGLYK